MRAARPAASRLEEPETGRVAGSARESTAVTAINSSEIRPWTRSIGDAAGAASRTGAGSEQASSEASNTDLQAEPTALLEGRVLGEIDLATETRERYHKQVHRAMGALLVWGSEISDQEFEKLL